MCYRLALELSGKIAAVAPVTANLPRRHADKRPTHPVGLLVINGVSDPLVPYGGGEVRVLGRSRGKIFSTDETLRRWAAFNSCVGKPTVRAVPDRAPGDRTRATVSTWPCSGAAKVELCRIEGGGHTWPGGRQYLPVALVGRVCHDFDAVPMIFDFFARHRRLPAPQAAPAAPGAPKPRRGR